MLRSLAGAGRDARASGWTAPAAAGSAPSSSGRPGRLAALRPTSLRLWRSPVDVVAVDMPVGLPATRSARVRPARKAFLGRAHSRVFLAPPRGVLAAERLRRGASRLHRELTGGLGLSVQTWHLVPKIREVDGVAGDPRLVEVHPELSFAELAGDGRAAVEEDRRRPSAARGDAAAGWLPDLAADDVPAGDDGLDALAAAWSGAALAGRRGAHAARAPARTTSGGRPMRIVT